MEKTENPTKFNEWKKITKDINNTNSLVNPQIVSIISDTRMRMISKFKNW